MAQGSTLAGRDGGWRGCPTGRAAASVHNGIWNEKVLIHCAMRSAKASKCLTRHQEATGVITNNSQHQEARDDAFVRKTPAAFSRQDGTQRRATRARRLSVNHRRQSSQCLQVCSRGHSVDVISSYAESIPAAAQRRDLARAENRFGGGGDATYGGGRSAAYGRHAKATIGLR